MLKNLRKIARGNVLLKITSFNAVAISVRIVAGLVTSKVVAFYLGAQGMALLGDLRNFMNSLQSVGTLGIYNGIVKYTAESKADKQKLSRFLSTSFFLILGTTLLISCILFFGATYFNKLLFDSAHDFTYIFRLLALALPFYSLNTFLIAAINGYSKYKFIIFINIATNILGLIITIFLIINYKITGAFYAVVLVPAIAIIVTVAAIFKKRFALSLIGFSHFRVSYIKRFVTYTGMTVFSAMLTPWIFIGIRQHIIAVDGMQNAGYWDAMLRLSDYYLMFATTVLTLYVLPKLAETTTRNGFRKEIFNFYKTILPLFGVGLIVLFFIKSYLIPIIFTKDFLTMLPIFKWQLAGDFFRVASIVIAYQFVAKNMFWYFVGTNIFSLAVIYGSSIYFVDRYGFVGAGMAHFLSYAVYLCVVVFIFRKSLFDLR